ncbi:MAG: enoyl-CoA hydratase/isomerase family protein [Acidobacteria bacterium]|nr:enoyl-CoA hydratase/isomerase family protein [Acidobacteriota bacterium]
MSSILFEKVDNYARIILSRPPLNIMNIEMMSEIGEALESLHNEEHIKLIVFSSACKVFSVGVDMADHTSQKVFQLLDAFHKIFLSMVEIGKPTVAAVNGAALGGGCKLATFCDVVIASETARFGQPEIKVGVFPSLDTVVFPYLVGKKKAMEMILMGEAIEGKEALLLGLVNRVVPADKLESTVKEFAAKITLSSGPVLRLMKRTMLSGEGLSFQDALKNVKGIYLNELMALEDTNEGLQAFVEHRARCGKTSRGFRLQAPDRPLHPHFSLNLFDQRLPRCP